jgi:outer membrane protein TolC
MGRYKNIILTILFCVLIEGFSSAEESINEKKYSLSLLSATELALSNSYDIQLIQYDHWINQTKKDFAESIYDALFEADVEYQNNQRKQSSTILGTKTIDNDYNVGISQKLPTGTHVKVDLQNNRHWTDTSFATSALTHDSTFGVSVTQDLGKNFLGIQDRGNIKVTLLDIENSQFTSLEKVERTIALVQKAYWDVVLANERVFIEQEMLEQAQKLFEVNQEKLKDKAIEAPEITASEANFEKRKNQLRFYKNELEHKLNLLKLLLNVNEEVVLEITEVFNLEDFLINTQESVKKAFDYRRDYKRYKNLIKSKDLELVIEKKNLWPEINLTASLEQNGLGDHFRQAVTQITEEDNPNFSAGIRVDIPLQNRQAKAGFEKAKLNHSKALIDLKLLERTIITEVVSQAQTCLVLKEVAAHNETITNLQAEKLVQEERRLAQGRSDTDTIIRFQEDLIQAKWNTAVSKHQYLVALIDLKVLEGGLLEDYLPDPTQLLNSKEK